MLTEKKQFFCSAIIVAAGSGRRMGTDVPKQFLKLLSKPVILHTIEQIGKCSDINEIVLVVSESDISYTKEILNACAVPITLTIGGQTRQQSVYNGLCAVDERCCIALIHDGARPLILPKTVSQTVLQAKNHGAAAAAVRVKDTLKVADSEGFIGFTPDREMLWQVQTPQAFEYGLIMDAHERAIEDGYEGTDDCVLVERLGKRVKLVEGRYDNIKITTKEDLMIAEGLFKLRGEGDV